VKRPEAGAFLHQVTNLNTKFRKRLTHRDAEKPTTHKGWLSTQTARETLFNGRELFKIMNTPLTESPWNQILIMESVFSRRLNIVNIEREPP
jgi:hypothetical protein